MGIGAAEGRWRVFCRFFGFFWRFLNFFRRTFEELILSWLGVLVSCLGQDGPKPPCLWSTSPFFRLHGCLGVCIVVWVAAARRKKRRTSSVFLLVRSGLNGFQLYSVLVSCLKEIRVALLVMLEEFRKETLWCESRKTDLHDKQNAGIVDWVAAGTRWSWNNMNDRSTVRLAWNSKLRCWIGVLLENSIVCFVQ